jgi:phosphoribosyl-ATP pyrophosphohydrolase/phosphoribosyl-AMP cyclohydrolase
MNRIENATEADWQQWLQFDERGLIPAVVQDWQSKKVLMVAFMNAESLQKTLQTGETWFWSRSRQQLWHKGATSGHIQKVVRITADCDGDSVLLEVAQTGPACHTGSYSCFHRPVGPDGGEPAGGVLETDRESAGGRFRILERLEETIAQRDAERPEGAYTTYLFEKGLDKILKKVGEESAEVIIAAKNRRFDELRYEAADLLYHLLVLLREQKIPLDEVLAELERRQPGGKQVRDR